MPKKTLNRFIPAWACEETSPLPRLFRSFLFPFSIANFLIQHTRAALYRTGVFSIRKLEARVISVGNLSMGGSGKTPAAALIARILQQKGMKPAILSRGYGGERKSKTPLVVSDGKNLLAGWEAAGDESYLLAKTLGDVPVLVGRDRVASGLSAMEKFSCDALILDDGFQHLRLGRNLNLCLVDCRGRSVFENLIFPSGSLRESVTQLKRADAFLLTRWEETPRAHALMQELKARFDKPLFRARHVPIAWLETGSGKEMDLPACGEKKVLAFCGIAAPDSFLHTLRALGIEPVAFFPFPDHHRYSPQDLRDIQSEGEGRGAELYVTTEKDEVKLAGGVAFPLWALRIRMQVLEEEGFQSLFDFTE